jgi:hypothetical protein
LRSAAADSPEKSAAAYFFALHNETARFRPCCSKRQQSGLPRNPAVLLFVLIPNGFFCASDLARHL